MPIGRKTAFRWTILYDDPLMASEVEERVREVVANWMRLYPKKYSKGWVTGGALGVLQVGVVIWARDQWTAQAESKRFAVALAMRAKVRATELRNPEPARLPHPRQLLHEVSNGA